ncbi:MAG: hypothetical protein IKC51_04325, partial [Myxococcaceae bacterium]|nr:hypothetical protein [Myxococcaceae bacterium]
GLLSRPESELTRKSQKLNRANTARLRGGEGKGRAREGKNMGFSLSHNDELNSLERGRAGAGFSRDEGRDKGVLSK